MRKTDELSRRLDWKVGIENDEQKQSWNLLESRSFDVHKNAAVSIIAMLGHSEVDIEVSDAGIETIESDSCRGISADDRDANNILATMWERARFFYKDR